MSDRNDSEEARVAGYCLACAWRVRLRLWAEGDRLRAEGDRLWNEAVRYAYRNASMTWLWRPEKRDYACQLANGETFEPEKIN